MIYYDFFCAILVVSSWIEMRARGVSHDPENRFGLKPKALAWHSNFHHSTNVTDELALFQDIFLKEQVDRLLRPGYLGQPTIVYVSLTIHSFGKLNFKHGALRVNFFLRQRWIDYRFQHMHGKPLVPFIGKKHPSDFLWVPDTVLLHTKEAKVSETTTSSLKLDIHPSGLISWATMISAEIFCDLDLRNYPMDIQTCSFGFESYSLSNRHIIYKFDGNNHLRFSSKAIPQFLLISERTENKTGYYVAGNYSVLQIDLVLKREVTLLIMNTFMPSVALVAVSWISLWVHKKSTSARLGTGITTLLTLTGIWLSVNRNIPKVSYLKAIDVYFIVSFLFILLTMVEYAVVAFVNFPLWKMKHHVSKIRRYSASKSATLAKQPPLSILSVYQKKKTINEEQNRTFHESVEEMKNARPRRKTDVVHAMMEDPDTSKRQSLGDMSARNTAVSDNESSSGNDSDDSSAEVQDIKTAHLYNPKTATLDIISRFIFPFSYLAFLIWFWNYYLAKFDNHSTFG